MKQFIPETLNAKVCKKGNGLILTSGYMSNHPLCEEVAEVINHYPVYTVHHNDNPDVPACISKGKSISNRYGVLIMAEELDYPFTFSEKFFNGQRSTNSMPFPKGMFAKEESLSMREVMEILIPKGKRNTVVKKEIVKLSFKAFGKFDYKVITKTSLDGGKTFFTSDNQMFFVTEEEAQEFQTSELNAAEFEKKKKEEKKLYKVFFESFFGRFGAGKSILCDSFSTFKGAEKRVEEILDSTIAYTEIREYRKFPAIIGAESDNGRTVRIKHNCLAVKVLYTDDDQTAAEETVKDALKKFEYPLVLLDCIDKERQCRNAYGKQLPEAEFEQIDPESDEAWFDDYQFTFAVIIGCADTAANRKELEIILRNFGLEIMEE